MVDDAKLISLFERYALIIGPIAKVFTAITYIGGPLISLWVLWMTYTGPNSSYWFSFLVLFSIVIGFKFGMSPLFAVGCTWIYYYDKVGFWLPIVSYIVAIIMLIFQMAVQKIMKSTLI